MRRCLAVVVATILAATVGFPGTSGADPSRFSGLDPGGPARLHEEVPVNFVFVGYEPSDVRSGAFLRGLPRTYRTLVRSRLWYGIEADAFKTHLHADLVASVQQ